MQQPAIGVANGEILITFPVFLFGHHISRYQIRLDILLVREKK